MYADDTILICPSVNGLQVMLDKCSEIANLLSLQFNVNKSHCLIIGKMCRPNAEISPMYLHGSCIEWSKVIKYLGVYLMSGKSVKFDINPVKRSFYSACNSIFMHNSSIDELALLTLQ